MPKRKPKSASQAGLFDNTQSASLSKKTGYIVTNQNNLNYILSNGWIVPRTIYSKYYDDLGKYTPDFVPILIHQPSNDLINQSVETTATTFPVIIEVNIYDLTGVLYSINKSSFLEIVRNTIDLKDDHSVVLIQGVIPLSRIEAVHFRTENEFKEFNVRSYVSRRKVEFKISSDLFISSDTSDINLLSDLGKFEVGGNISQSLYNRTSAFAGASLLVSNVWHVNQNLPFETILWLLRPILSVTKDMNIVQEASRPSILRHWLEVISRVLFEELFSLDESTLHNAASAHMTEQQAADTALLKTCIAHLLNYSIPSSFVSEQFLDEILGDFGNLLFEVIPHHSDTLLEHYRDVFTRMHQVLDSSISLDEFFAFLSFDTEITTGLLCFLLRPRPEDTVTWSEDLDVSKSNILAIALIFSGILYKRGRIPVNSSETSSMTDFIDYLAAHVVNHITGSIAFTKLQDELAMIETHSTQELRYKNKALLSRNIHNIPDTSIIDRLAESSFADPNEESAAILISQKMGWFHCLTSVIQLTDREFSLQYHKSRKEMRVAGTVNIQIQLNSAEFKKQIVTMDKIDLVTHVDDHILKLMNRS